MSSRNWQAIAEHYVRVVREGKLSADAAINDIELELLAELDVEKINRRINFGYVELGTWRNAFNWLSSLARYQYVRFVGVGSGRWYFGLLVGSRTPPTELRRQARELQLLDMGNT